MSTVWFTSDLHIGHELVARIRATGQVLPRYVGAEIDWHNRTLAANWDRVVGKRDLVYVLGDISSGASTAQRDALDWIEQRTGRKRIILGNHDKPHPMHRDSGMWETLYRRVFDRVQMAERVRVPVPDGHRDVMLSHFPYDGDRGANRYEQWRLRDCGDWLLHGHTHSQQITSDLHDRQLHIGVDAWDLTPVSLAEVSAFIQRHEGI